MNTICSGLYGETIQYMNNQRNILIKIFNIIFLLALSIVILSGCNASEDTQLCKEAKEEAQQVFEYIKDEDIDNLSSLFNAKTRENKNLKESWENFFEQTQGIITEYDKLEVMETQRTYSKGELTFLVLRIKYTNVKTDTGEIYEEMMYYKTAKCNHAPDKEGISWFTLQISKNDKEQPVLLTVGD